MEPVGVEMIARRAVRRGELPVHRHRQVDDAALATCDDDIIERDILGRFFRAATPARRASRAPRSRALPARKASSAGKSSSLGRAVQKAQAAQVTPSYRHAESADETAMDSSAVAAQHQHEVDLAGRSGSAPSPHGCPGRARRLLLEDGWSPRYRAQQASLYDRLCSALPVLATMTIRFMRGRRVPRIPPPWR